MNESKGPNRLIVYILDLYRELESVLRSIGSRDRGFVKIQWFWSPPTETTPKKKRFDLVSNSGTSRDERGPPVAVGFAPERKSSLNLISWLFILLKEYSKSESESAGDRRMRALLRKQKRTNITWAVVTQISLSSSLNFPYRVVGKVDKERFAYVSDKGFVQIPSRLTETK